MWHISFWFTYADVMTLIENVNKRTKKHKSSVSKEICLEVNVDKIKYIFMSRHQTRGQTH
jgi:hypothetical protein